MPSFPPEILLEILGYLKPHYDALNTRTLAACCLVSKPFLQPARDVLYRQVTVACYSSLSNRSHGPRRFARELVVAEEDGIISVDPVTWGLAPGCSVDTILAYPHLAVRARSVSFHWGHHKQGTESDDEAEDWLEDSKGAAVKESAFRLAEQVLKACPLVNGIRVTDGPPSALYGLADNLKSSNKITSLEIDVVDQYGFLRPVAPFAALCQSMAGLKHLNYRGPYVEDEEWTASTAPSYSLETLMMEFLPGSFEYLVGDSASSLKLLKLVGHVPPPTLDLSKFVSLQQVELDCKGWNLASPCGLDPLWIPPSPSQIIKLVLSPLSIHVSEIPEIPFSVRHLTLHLYSLSNALPPTPSPNAEFPFFASLPACVHSLPNLESLKIVASFPTEILEHGGYLDASRELLRSLCAEKGIELTDGAAEMAEGWVRRPLEDLKQNTGGGIEAE